MKALKILAFSVASIAVLSGCGGDSGSDRLEVDTLGFIDEQVITSGENVEGLVTATYAWLGNDHYTAPNLLWPSGNLRAGDALKGGNGPADIFGYEAMSLYAPITADMASINSPDFVDFQNKKWSRNYTGISRANLALKNLGNANEFDLRTTRIAETRFLRAFWYFDLKIHHKRVPWIDESMTDEDILAASNVDLTDQELWQKIVDDLRFSAENLPATQPQVGRVNKYAAKAFLAKVLLYKAYEQNDMHEVVAVNPLHLQEVVDLVDEIESSGVYDLSSDYGDNFLAAGDNSVESVFEIQRSRDDGSPDGKGSYPTALNGPQANLAGFYGCCGFHVPTDNFVNAFKTDADGLPLFDTYNNALIQSADVVDPRLDHTVGMQGKPFKYSADIHGGNAWARNPALYGNYTSMKELEHPGSGSLMLNGPFTISSMNTKIIRYADVLLWKAEALIELGTSQGLEEARAIINRIRDRAAFSISKVAGTSIYNVGNYDDSFADQDEARRALRWERRLELGLEGWRFFDLVRWGVAKETIDAYLAVAKTRKTWLSDAEFIAGKHEYLPIPLTQLNLSGGLYVQNPGY
ncbi:MAG: RagB/SusD family nutrient uptake outer membrane protein [Gammaproteobacteria bacterium]|uniref:RagB/SusD family nutrient uptake outer membrane protein n=1 Tax=Pseudomaricurvus alcaniphilus TaxID=1166482 RepID=UPI00140C88B3|nr:RagB/SusD family nutrient uptake outer membrane protein [Pseudomaricurvus alcaniphilus]MBR9911178.1 RagB/SusD family nutrient uptake outer membrane protein [Gammaproteobacteria bacterium]NHN36342.1 RagB/SusD family nutrient uptake outer membrane protein [Pseudomaricurvus alcaniphilus]